MKYCTKCGEQIDSDAVFCPYCGARNGDNTNVIVSQNEKKKANSGLVVAAIIFMILGTIFDALYIYVFSLVWTIPMTICYISLALSDKKIGKGFKICCLLFVSLIAGILMLCDDK